MTRLRAEVKRLNRLMGDLLEYGRPRPLQRKRSRIDRILNAASSSRLRSAETTSITIDVQKEAEFEVNVDPDRMRQVFQNLIENAVQHAPDNGIVAIRVRREVRGGAPWVVIAVEDAGPGFEPGDLRRVFEPFFTKRRGGTGLGLSIVSKIVEEHGGTVTAMNRPGGGAEIEVALPAPED